MSNGIYSLGYLQNKILLHEDNHVLIKYLRNIDSYKLNYNDYFLRMLDFKDGKQKDLKIVDFEDEIKVSSLVGYEEYTLYLLVRCFKENKVHEIRENFKFLMYDTIFSYPELLRLDTIDDGEIINFFETKITRQDNVLKTYYLECLEKTITHEQDKLIIEEAEFVTKTVIYHNQKLTELFIYDKDSQEYIRIRLQINDNRKVFDTFRELAYKEDANKNKIPEYLIDIVYYQNDKHEILSNDLFPHLMFYSPYHGSLHNFINTK